MLGDFRVDRTECGFLGCNYIFGKLGQTRQDKTWLNLRLTVSMDLSNLFSACLTGCGGPIMYKNSPKASLEHIFEVECNPYLSTNCLCNNSKT